MPLWRSAGGQTGLWQPQAESLVAQSARRMDRLAQQLADLGCPPATRELRFAEADTGRRWRFDLAWPDYYVALEVEGGIWKRTRTRHLHPSGFLGDLVKYNEAARLGWRVLRCSWDDAERETATLAKLVLATLALGQILLVGTGPARA